MCCFVCCIDGGICNFVGDCVGFCFVGCYKCCCFWVVIIDVFDFVELWCFGCVGFDCGGIGCGVVCMVFGLYFVNGIVKGIC